MMGLSNNARAGIAWGIVVAFVVMAVGLQSFRGAPAGESATSPTTQIQFSSGGKTTIGNQMLFPETGGAALGALDWLARTPELKVQTAIIAKEVAGNAEALKRLDVLAQNGSEAIARDIVDLTTAITQGGATLDETARSRLIERHGFFGELATTFGSTDTDPLRARLLRECRRTALVLVGLEVVIGLALLAGVILLIVAVVFWFEGGLRPAYVRRLDDDPVWLEAFAVFLVTQVLASMIVPFLPGGSSLLVSWIMTSPVALAAALWWPRLRNIRGAEIRYALGLHRGKGWLVEAGMGILGYIAGLPLLAGGLVVTALLVRYSSATPSHPLVGEPTNSIPQALAMYLLASVGAPVVEEIVFRGALFHHLRRRWNWLLSAALVAFIFAAIHPQGWTTVPALGAIAIVLAGIREWRGSLVGPIVAHGLSNGLVVTLLLLIK